MNQPQLFYKYGQRSRPRSITPIAFTHQIWNSNLQNIGDMHRTGYEWADYFNN